jgi:hypothetical protein
VTIAPEEVTVESTPYRPEIHSESNLPSLPEGEISLQEWLQREKEYNHEYQQQRAPLGHQARGSGRRGRRIDLPTPHSNTTDSSTVEHIHHIDHGVGGAFPQLAAGVQLSDKLKDLLFSGRSGPKNYALQRQLMKSEQQGHQNAGPSLSSSASTALSSAGQQQQLQPCATYLKTGACRLGTQCVFLHKPPTTSRTVLLRGVWPGAASLGKQLVGDDALEADIDETERQNEILALHEDLSSELRSVGSSLRSVKILSNESPHLSGLVFVFFGAEMDAANAVATLNGRYYAGRQIQAELSPVQDWNQAVCASLPDCPKGASCTFPHVYETPDEPFFFELGGGGMQHVSASHTPLRPASSDTTHSSLFATPKRPVEYIYTPKDLRGVRKSQLDTSPIPPASSTSTNATDSDRRHDRQSRHSDSRRERSRSRERDRSSRKGGKDEDDADHRSRHRDKYRDRDRESDRERQHREERTSVYRNRSRKRSRSRSRSR